MFLSKTTPDMIIDKLYLGNMNCSENLEKLLELKISHILVSASYLKAVFPEVKKI